MDGNPLKVETLSIVEDAKEDDDVEKSKSDLDTAPPSKPWLSCFVLVVADAYGESILLPMRLLLLPFFLGRLGAYSVFLMIGGIYVLPYTYDSVNPFVIEGILFISYKLSKAT